MIFTNFLTAGMRLDVGFFNISKIFDKVWHDGIIFKLEKKWYICKLRALHDFVVSRKQRVVFNEQVSSWANVKADVPQGLILGSLLFLI